MKTPKKTWTPTKQQGLYRHISDTYYARVTVAGKPTWRTLKTSVYEIAKVELEKLQEEIGHKNELAGEVTLHEHLTGADAIKLRQQQIANSVTLKPSTRKYWGEIIAYITKTWPQFLKAQLRKVTIEECQTWASSIVKVRSPTRYNNTMSMIKSLFAIAVKKGARRTNPADSLKRVRVRYKDLSSRLPNKTKFKQWIETIRSSGGRHSASCADLVEFLAYTGLRIGEAAWVRWQNCEFERGEIVIEGDPIEATKNSDQRRIPMIPAARQLLDRLKLNRPAADPASSLVLKVHKAQKAMDRAALKVGMARLTHHDLRHFFATTCIESGVDIPTVSRWLGHRDGGALALKVYGHLRNDHSLAAASRVSFAA